VTNPKSLSSDPVTKAPWPRYVVDTIVWHIMIDQLVEGSLSLCGLWAESDKIHMSVYDESASDIKIISLPLEDGKYPSVSSRHPPALRLERALYDMSGIIAVGCPDTRPWLDHGQWALSFPLADGSFIKKTPSEYVFLPVEGDGIHQIPVGPIHAGIIEPGHFRFSANGETVIRLEERLGYVHKGVEKLFQGKDVISAAKIAGRISGDSTVAYALAYALAVETALEIKAPERAQWLRALMAELERLANHCGDIGAVCNDAAFSLLHAHFGVLREEVLQLTELCFGHRLSMDVICPGGVSTDLTPDAAKRLEEWLEPAEKRFNKLVQVYDDCASLKNRTQNTGFVREDLVRTYGVGGFVGRASGRNFDARKNLSYSPYDQLTFDVTVLNAGDVNARVWVRICEVTQVFSLLRQLLMKLPSGAIVYQLPESLVGDREGMAIVEGFRGDIFMWLHICDGRLVRCYARDPSWFQWPLLENCIKGNIVADFPLCNKSFNCSYSGHDG